MRSQIIRSATGVAGLKAANFALVFFSGVLLARWLGPDNYGMYAFCVSLVTLLGLPTKAGLPTLVLRETSLNQLQEKWGELSGLLRVSNIFVLGYSLFVALASWAIVTKLSDRFSAEFLAAFIFSLLLLPVVAFGNVRGATLRGLRKVVQGQFPEDIIRPGALILFIIVAQIFTMDTSAVFAMQLHVAACFVAFVVGAVLLVMALPVEVRRSKPEYEYHKWVGSLIPLSLFSGLRLLDSQLNIILLGALASIEDVALFRVATQGAIAVSFGLTVMNLTISPHIARLYKSGDLLELQRLITRSTRFVAFVSIPVFLVFVLFSRDIVTFIFGDSYAGAAIPLVIICFGQLVNCLCGSVSLVLNMTGYERDSVKGVVIAVFVSVISMIILVPKFAAVGGAIAYTASLIIWNISLVIITKKRTGIKTFIF